MWFVVLGCLTVVGWPGETWVGLVKLMVWSGLVVFLDISALVCCAVGFDCWWVLVF